MSAILLSQNQPVRKYFGLAPENQEVAAPILFSAKKIDSFFRVKLYAREINFKQREQTMETRLLLALVGLAIGFVLPTFAQEKEEANPFLYRAILASPQLAQQLDVINRQLDEAFNKHDAVAVAALFTTNATLVAPLGIVSGRDGVEKYFADVFNVPILPIK